MRRTCIIVPAVVWIVLGSLSFISSGCQNNAKLTDTTSTSATNAQPSAVQDQDIPSQLVKGGARTWSENCMRCHNLRSPLERGDREWSLIMHHMRVRANLTAQEHRSILQFLQSAN